MASKLTLLAALAWCVIAGPAEAQPRVSDVPMVEREARVQQDAASVKSLRDVRRLHLAYTQLAEHGLWQEMADLFAENGELISGDRHVAGRQAIRDWLANEYGGGGPLAEGERATLLPFTPVANLGADGRTAKVRWHELGMLGGKTTRARWTGGIYENDYVLVGDTWQIARMRYYPQFAGTYEQGWRNVVDDLPVVPFHYTPDIAGIPIPELTAGANTGDTAVLAGGLDDMLIENAVRNLQNVYGYYVDRRMWGDVADLFEADGVLDIAGVGQWQGPASIRRGLEREGPQGLPAGVLNEHVQFPLMVIVGPDGTQARARGVELAMTGENDGRAYWQLALFENTFKLRGGIWRIAEMRLFPRFRADYAEGWGQSRLDPVLPSGDQRPDRRSAAAAGAVPAFSYLHPVTGKAIALTGSPVAELPAPYPSGAGQHRAAGPWVENARKVALLAADIGAENVSNAFGNYIDDFEWGLLGDLFARKGAREMPYAGFYIGPERITAAEVTKWGARRSPRRSIPIHLRMQPVIDVTADGRAARFRTRLFSIGSSWDTAGNFSGGIYPNEQAVLEDGKWKLWTVGIDEFYYRSASYEKGWTGVAAEPAEKVPDMLIKAYPPDIALTELGQRQQGYIPGSRQFNPYIHNGPAYPGYPSATAMWFGYVNPVSGRVPEYYWPDCVTCAAHPETSLQANGY